MQKGLLHEIKVNLNSPNRDKEIANFVEEVRERMAKYDIKKFVMAKKQEGDVVHMVVLPCSGSSADQAAAAANLESQGFETAQASTINEMHSYATTEIDPVSVEFKFGK